MSKLAEFLAPYIERVEYKNIIGAVSSNEIKRQFNLIAFDSQGITRELTLPPFSRAGVVPEPEVCLWAEGEYFEDVAKLDSKYFYYYIYEELISVDYISGEYDVDTFAILEYAYPYERVVAYYNTKGLTLDDIVGKAFCGRY